MTPWCHQNKIHEIHYQVDPENLNTHLFNIHTGDNSEDINETIRQAALNSTNSDSYLFEYVIEQAQQVDGFNRENPGVFEDYLGRNTQQALDEMQETKDEISSLRLIEKGIIPADYMQSITVANSIAAVMGIEMMQDISYRPLTISCEEIDINESCTQLSKLLRQGKTMRQKTIGFGLYEVVQKSLDNDENMVKENRKKKIKYIKALAVTP